MHLQGVLMVMSFIVLVGCGEKSSSTVIIEDAVSDSTQFSNADQEKLDRFLQDFEVAKNGYPSIVFSYQEEVASRIVEYYFENDNLVWVHIEVAGERGTAEDFFVSLDPEGNAYLHYGTNLDGSFGTEDTESSKAEWMKITATDDTYKPIAAGPGAADAFDYEAEYAEHMKTVRETRDKFTLTNGSYQYVVSKENYKGEYGQAEKVKSYRVSEILFSSNLLSPTSFNPKLIEGYLNWWYPLYADASDVFYRHIGCTGDEDYIIINVEAGHYRWDEEIAGKKIEYTITGFEESEGDAFYATIERGGNRFKKTLVFSETDGLLLIDGQTYTSEPKKYDYTQIKCD